MDKKYQKQREKEQRQTEKWLPKIIRVNGIFGAGTPELSSSTASQ